MSKAAFTKTATKALQHNTQSTLELKLSHKQFDKHGSYHIVRKILGMNQYYLFILLLAI